MVGGVCAGPQEVVVCVTDAPCGAFGALRLPMLDLPVHLVHGVQLGLLVEREVLAPARRPAVLPRKVPHELLPVQVPVDAQRVKLLHEEASVDLRCIDATSSLRPYKLVA